MTRKQKATNIAVYPIIVGLSSEEIEKCRELADMDCDFCSGMGYEVDFDEVRWDYAEIVCDCVAMKLPEGDPLLI